MAIKNLIIIFLDHFEVNALSLIQLFVSTMLKETINYLPFFGAKFYIYMFYSLFYLYLIQNLKFTIV